jgi:hypothetical protein
MNEQVTSLSLLINDEDEAVDENALGSSDAFQLVFSSCRGLVDLRFTQTNLCLSREYFLGRLPTSCCSSILTKLNIQVENFSECLVLLDGRFQCLSTFLVYTVRIIQESETR